MVRKATFADFVKMSQSKHGTRYSYARAAEAFVNYASYVTIICNIHGAFVQQASVHAHKGNGCSACNKKLFERSDTATFVRKATAVHAGKYDYSRVAYSKNNVEVEIRCPDHGYFTQTPASHIHQQAGCWECAKDAIGRANGRTQEEFLTEAKAVHGDTYDYSGVVYVQQYAEVDILCQQHGIFSQLPKLHLKGCGCPKCAYERGPQLIVDAARQTFVQRAAAVFADRYSYDSVDYQGYRTDVVVGCPEHGDFSIKPGKHLQGQGCPTCSSSKTFSEKACDWLDVVAEREGVTIRHGRNGGEYKIPGTNYRADGYCEETGVLYEFYGTIAYDDDHLLPRDCILSDCFVCDKETFGTDTRRDTRQTGTTSYATPRWGSCTRGR